MACGLLGVYALVKQVGSPLCAKVVNGESLVAKLSPCTHDPLEQRTESVVRVWVPGQPSLVPAVKKESPATFSREA